MVKGHWSESTGQGSLVRVKGQWSKVTGQESVANGHNQWSKGLEIMRCSNKVPKSATHATRGRTDSSYYSI